MKRFCAFLILLCILLSYLPALGEVYVKQTPPEEWSEKNVLVLTVFRTGEGDCMLLQCGGESMMIDGGPWKYREKLRDALKERGISHVKYLFSTHPHDDHIKGLEALMRYELEAEEFVSVFAKDVKDPEGNQQAAMKVLDKAGIPYRQISSGDVLTLGNAVLTVYNWPRGTSINARSAMAKLVYGDCSALLCADITGDTEKEFLSTLGPEALKADVIKAPHHGITPFVPAFLDAVDPSYIFVTNYHGDRSGPTERQAENRKLPIQYSGDGTIILTTDGTDWYIYQTLYQF